MQSLSSVGRGGGFSDVTEVSLSIEASKTQKVRNLVLGGTDPFQGVYLTVPSI